MQNSLQDILLSDLVMIMEHGQMSMLDGLKMSLNFIEIYDRSQAFEYRAKILERDTLALTGLYKRFDAVIKILAARR
ncbi:hypothetical protein [Psychrobacter sp.]|uniref:hypothetical protein n=1 Tax=Psychrobacter sp. TaxID=56811 RepID=UPI0025E5688D|nr:hypothetical protein [Psychrobacter sp.]